MKQFVREYFTFNRRERNGIFVLLSIIILLLIYLKVSNKFIQHENVDFTKFEAEIQALNAAASAIEKKNTLRENLNKPERFIFNPNNLPENDWKRLGLSDKQIRSIRNYESKGGRFLRKEDVKKMYTIPLELYNSLETYIEIPDEEKLQSIKITHPKNTRSETGVFELNSVDSLQLTAIKGIGPFYAKTIIKYRNLLGGYHSKEQLMEVWKFDKEKYAMIERYITVDASKIKKININTCTAKELKHPYLSWKIANGIINYREKHGDFYTVEEIKKTDLLDEETFSKISIYLDTDN